METSQKHDKLKPQDIAKIEMVSCRMTDSTGDVFEDHFCMALLNKITWP